MIFSTNRMFSPMTPNVLLIEDENNIAENLKYALKTEGIDCTHCSTATEGLKRLRSDHFDIVILDIGLPDKSGFDVCKEIRAKSQIPIFFLTARAEEIDKILGLEIGADDYITKPFSPREVTARIRAFFRRNSELKPATGSSKVKNFEILEDRFQIKFMNVDLALRRYEFGVLKFLLENPGRVYSRAQIMERVWHEPDMSLERTIDTHIKIIRAKLKQLSDEELILTHRGIGYSIKD
jgi:two-component system, OmpR family, catabolic regulation response regulator CreB